jgi:hypothetical protein
MVDCLRFFYPFAAIVQEFSARIASSPKPVMIDYVMEYSVAFALVAN